MYKKHRVFLALIIILCGAVSFAYKVDYAEIASEAITVVSIVLAIYMTSFSGLVSSELAKTMQRKEDKILTGKSQLGVLRSYLNVAVVTGILNIIVACISLIISSKMETTIEKGILYYIVSASGCSTLGANIFLMLLLYRFMVNRQLWNK